MVSQLLDRLFSKDRCRYPIPYGELRESLSIGGREGMRFLFFVTDQKIATVLTACLRREIDIPTVYNSFLEYKRDLIRGRKRAISTPVLFTKEQMVSYVQDSINEMPAVPLFLLTQAYEAGIELFHLQEKVAFAFSSIERQVSLIPPGLVDGAHRLACELAMAVDSGLLPHDLVYVEWINQLLSKEDIHTGISKGIAGYGMTNLICADFVPSIILSNRLKGYSEYLAAEASNITTLDFEKGIAGISYFLLCYAQKFGVVKASSAGQEILFDLIEKAVYKGGTVNWGTGTCCVLPFLIAYEVTGLEVYKRYAESSLYEPTRESIKLGGIYLQMHDILRDTWLMKAYWIIQTQIRFKEKDVQLLPFILDYAA